MANTLTNLHSFESEWYFAVTTPCAVHPGCVTADGDIYIADTKVSSLYRKGFVYSEELMRRTLYAVLSGLTSTNHPILYCPPQRSTGNRLAVTDLDW